MRRLLMVSVALLAAVSCNRTTTIANYEGVRDDQWARGVWLYGQNCAGCHGENGEGNHEEVPAIAGKGALPQKAPEGRERDETFDDADDLFQYVKSSMPPLEPGCMSDDEYYAVVNYLLKQAHIEAPGEDIGKNNASSVRLH